MVLLFLAACNLSGGNGSIPEDAGDYASYWYIDPLAGSNENDGRSEQAPWKDLTPLSGFYPAPSSRIQIKRGTILRLGATWMLRGGSEAGWVCYGAYGDTALPKPILVGSVAIEAMSWKAARGQSGIIELDWSPWLDVGNGRAADGVEQGPGNLWFFGSGEAEAGLQAWGWRKPEDIGASSAPGDWYYAAASHTIRLRWDGNPPSHTEAAVNRSMVSYRGQSWLIVEDLDLRYGGGYVLAGNEASHLRLRRLDISFSGGGTKNASFVRLGNGIEFSGNVQDIVVENCRIHQVYDSGFDQQNVGSLPVSQAGLIFRNNLVSHAGLAGCEIWSRPTGSTITDLLVQGNTFLHSGRGWGWEQHDHPGQSRIGGDIVIFDNRATASGVEISGNVFFNPRVVLLAEFRSDQAATRALVQGLSMDGNVWWPGRQNGDAAVILFKGSMNPDGSANLGDSTVLYGLADWQASSEVPGKDAGSVQVDPGFKQAIDAATQDSAWIRSLAADSIERPQLFGAFGLAGDYRR